MTSLADLARRWMRQTEIGKGIRLDSDDMDLLNALGVGDVILTSTARRQREQCLKKTTTSIQGENTGLRGIESETERSEAHTPRSSGMTTQQNAFEAAQRARRICQPRKMLSTGSISNGKGDKRTAPHADSHSKTQGATS